jgi:predicted TPR repeat methyltransferase
MPGFVEVVRPEDDSAMADTRPDITGNPAAAERELSLTPEQALALAIERHQLDQLDDAEMIYAALLERWPDHPDALNYMGVLQHQRGEDAAALALLRHAVEVSPDTAGIWNNLGNVLKHQRQTDEAERAFRRSIELAESPQALSNLGSLLRRRGLWAEGEAACRRAIEIAPAFGDAWHHLTLLLIAQGRVAEASAAARQATALLPPGQRRRGSYTRALVNAGHIDDAVALFREWLAEEPDNAYVRHHLAACLGEGTPERASDAYVEQAFDEFAASFDTKLATLGYRAPALVAEALAAMLPAPARQFDIADLGCGTGLCGPLIAPWARRLSGCDLSASMLELAQRRAVYDRLDKAELLAYLEAHGDAFDVVVSADTLCYFGALEGVARAARSALRPSGQLVFTVEALPEDDGASHRLLPHGRYAHARPYLRAVLDGAGFVRQRIGAEVLRSEGGLPVSGWLVSASRE